MKDLITLRSYSISFDSDNLVLHGEASAINPFPEKFSLTTPRLPFIVCIPQIDSDASVLCAASVHNEPISLTRPNITIAVAGNVLPLPASSASTLSMFISRFLSSKSNPIEIVTPILPGLTIETVIPGPQPRPQILRNVTIHNMKIHTTTGGGFLASGTVYARAVLPKGLNIEADVERILPDVLIFDGEVPDGVEISDESDHFGEPPPPRPLPDPLPEHAFARLRPDDWVLSISTPDAPEEGEGSTYTVTADIADVPLQLLPGRERDFRRFVAKVRTLSFESRFSSHDASMLLLSGCLWYKRGVGWDPRNCSSCCRCSRLYHRRWECS